MDNTKVHTPKDENLVYKACLEAAKPYWEFLVFVESLKRNDNNTLIESITRGTLTMLESVPAAPWINKVLEFYYGDKAGDFMRKHGLAPNELDKQVRKEYAKTVGKPIATTITKPSSDNKTFAIGYVPEDVVGKKF